MNASILTRAFEDGRCCLLSFTLALLVAGCSGPKAKLHITKADSAAELRELFTYSPERIPLVSAHRGGAVPGYPENCLATFEHTLGTAYSIMEIDLRFTKDGDIVLHHDTTLDRTTTGSGPVANFTVEALKQLKLKDPEGTVTEYRIPTLDEGIEWARGKTILILDKKDVPVETCVQKIREHQAQSFVMIMVGNIDSIKKVHALDPDIMMEVFLGTRERFDAFDQSGVPWDRIVPFISHQPPEDLDLIERIHAKGSSCLAGTSRYLDRELKTAKADSLSRLKTSYQDLLASGIDIIETDLPVEVTQLIFQNAPIPARKARFFETR